MPIIASAIKKLRKDRKRTLTNAAKKTQLTVLVKKAQKTKKPEAIKAAIRVIDKAVKRHLLHKNKAARLKSRLAQLVKRPTPPSQKTKDKKPKKPKKNVS